MTEKLVKSKKRATINGIPYWYYPDEDNFEPKYFFCDTLLWITDKMKYLISLVTGIENTFYIQIYEKNKK